MSVKQFKFVSPGVFINEIDNSGRTDTSTAIGPTVIGRTERGPSFTPVRIESYSEFVNIFGEAIPGGDTRDVWRNGNYTAPTYAAYAAQAYLKNSSPVNVVRLLGAEDPNASADGKAGWQATTAYGLYITPTATRSTGTLAAIWYCEAGTSVRLTGSSPNNAQTSSVGTLVKNIGTDYGFKAQIVTNSSVAYTTEFNFNEASDKFIRKVFNTNPTLTNGSIGSTSLSASYWLGETYENWLGNVDAGHDVTGSSLGAGSYYGLTLLLQSEGASGANNQKDHRKPFRSAETDYVFSQDMSNDTASFGISASRTPNLFKFVTVNAGLWEGQNFKISIEDIRESVSDDNPYGTFSVVIRRAGDSDSAVRFVERYSNCNLNPQSEDYIAKKIGDKYLVWDDSEGRYREYGKFINRSSYIRVVMDVDVDAGLTPAGLLPAGFRGPQKWAGIGIASGTVGVKTEAGGATATTVPVKANSGVTSFGFDIASAWSASFIHPGHLPRVDSTSAPSATRAYFGYDSNKGKSSTLYSRQNLDFARSLCDGLYDAQFSATGTGSIALTRTFEFTLDDLSGSVGSNSVDSTPATMYWASGNRAAGTSYRGTASFGAMLRKGFDSFTLPLYGGNDGLNVKEMEPFRNSAINTGDTSATNYAVHSIRRAIDSVADPEVVDTNMITMPGLTNQGLVTRMITTCENRSDALAIVDLKGGYQPNTEANGSEQDRKGDLETVVTNIQALQVNSSYGCAYYPWVQIRDPEKGAQLWVPPSVVALGVFANTERRDELWFAPAGFNRGGLSQGASGLPVLATTERLTSKERDSLYDANINPIANFPNEGIVVFGQKTLQITPSALDRINVRRLMNYVKKEISRMAGQVLFQPNVEETWNGFTSMVEPFLASVKARFGLDDFKVVLDKTTTTPELIDRNIVYAKIFLKPTKAIEYIAIDFNITNSGASFED